MRYVRAGYAHIQGPGSFWGWLRAGALLCEHVHPFDTHAQCSGQPRDVESGGLKRSKTQLFLLASQLLLCIEAADALGECAYRFEAGCRRAVAGAEVFKMPPIDLASAAVMAAARGLLAKNRRIEFVRQDHGRQPILRILLRIRRVPGSRYGR
jgi:hypothetical protein